MARQSRNPHMQTDMQSITMDTPTDSLFEAYHKAIADRDRAARALFNRAANEVIEAVWQGLHHFDPEAIRKAATYGHCEVDAVWKLMSTTIQGSTWVLEPWKAKALLDGADACGISPWSCYAWDYGTEGAEAAEDQDLASHVLQCTVRDRLQTYVEAMARHMGVWSPAPEDAGF